MFKFGFTIDDTESVSESTVESDNIEWFESKEITPKYVSLTDVASINSIECGSYNIKYLSDKDAIRLLEGNKDSNSSVLTAEQKHSDLITAVYEGGLKIWECTFDILNFIANENLNLTNKRVLDLGCGAGLLGIYSCLEGSETVFQDYNVEVINSVTIPNVCLNNISFDKCKFYCGDWQSFLNLLNRSQDEKEKFDFIFTSETIYNVKNYEKILNIFKQLLQKTGVIYLAAKSHYFGVGGSISLFVDLLKAEDIFHHTTCWTCSNGVKRAIIKITLK